MKKYKDALILSLMIFSVQVLTMLTLGEFSFNEINWFIVAVTPAAYLLWVFIRTKNPRKKANPVLPIQRRFQAKRN